MTTIPPYGRSLFDLQKQGLKPTDAVFVWIGDNAWKKASDSIDVRPNATLVLPPWICPTSYMWPVKGCRVLIIDTGYAKENYLNDLAYCLYQGGADDVFCSTSDGNFITFHKE